MIEWLLYIVLGAGLGTLGGLFGIGGGLIAIPALGVLFGLDQQLAQGTALVMVVPNVLLALWRYHQRNRIELRHALPLSACSFVFAWLGSIWAVGIDAHAMPWVLSGFWWRWPSGTWRGCFSRPHPPARKCAMPGHGWACWAAFPGPWAACSVWAVQWLPRQS